MVKWDVFQESRMVQYPQINPCAIPHQQKNNKNHIITSTEVERAFDKIPYPFME